MKIKIITILSIVLVMFFSSCNKYEDGPILSLKSPEKRIQGDYIVDKYLINETEVSLADQGITEYRVIYNSDGTGTSYITVNNNTLETEFQWEFDEKKEVIRERSLGLNNEWSAWSDYKQILRLTKDEFWIIDINSLEPTEIHFIEN